MKNIIKQLREENNITQEELSKITNISTENLNLIENDQLEPLLTDAHNITKALNKDYIAEVFLFDDID